mgnify:CR=1 FL=1
MTLGDTPAGRWRNRQSRRSPAALAWRARKRRSARRAVRWAAPRPTRSPARRPGDRRGPSVPSNSDGRAAVLLRDCACAAPIARSAGWAQPSGSVATSTREAYGCPVARSSVASGRLQRRAHETPGCRGRPHRAWQVRGVWAWGSGSIGWHVAVCCCCGAVIVRVTIGLNSIDLPQFTQGGAIKPRLRG